METVLIIAAIVFVVYLLNKIGESVNNQSESNKKINKEDAFKDYLRNIFEKDLLKFYNESKLKGTGFDGYAIDIFISSMYKSLMKDSVKYSKQLGVSHQTIQDIIEDVTLEIRNKYLE